MEIELKETEFQNCLRKFNNMENQDKNILFYDVYGLYKQSLFGDNKVQKPYWFNFKSLNKWRSWKKENGKSKENAKDEYIFIIKTYLIYQG